MTNNKNVSTDAYRGVRDFYPKDWLFQKWLFWKMQEVVESYGYENYNASPLEYSSLFIAKSGSEIVENETYNLTDRGGREVTLRPEMTPTVARMIAKKRNEIPLPIRWYSIPNLFRYEKPQKGRLREHYQLNVDFFGQKELSADIEIIEIGYKIMQNIGAEDKDFVIKINNRKIINKILDHFANSKDDIYELSKIIDKKNKISKEDFKESLEQYTKNADDLIEILENNNFEKIKDIVSGDEIEKTLNLIGTLKEKGVSNTVFDLSLMRGFDYYTDIVFEFFDTHPENNRSLFGGGRYDDLLDIFGKEKIPAVGFGMGDVTARNFLEIRNKMPDLKSKTKIVLIPVSKDFENETEKLAGILRENKINTELDLLYRKLSRSINSAEKKNIEFVLLVGENEVQNQKYNLKNILTQEVFENLSQDELIEIFKKRN
ncbi:histidine--tRNA ligase [Candidatus Campbellbacteria bacterium]|nr:MAG: histidine--tRNA ligase [Candidatus Campbellbacteria bacterium]